MQRMWASSKKKTSDLQKEIKTYSWLQFSSEAIVSFLRLVNVSATAEDQMASLLPPPPLLSILLLTRYFSPSLLHGSPTSPACVSVCYCVGVWLDFVPVAKQTDAC